MLLFIAFLQLFFNCPYVVTSEECHLQRIDEVCTMVTDFADAFKWNRVVLYSDQIKGERDKRWARKNIGMMRLIIHDIFSETTNAIFQVDPDDHLALWCSNFSRCQEELDPQLLDEMQLFVGKEIPISNVFRAQPIKLQNSLCLECCEQNNYTISYINTTNDSAQIGHWSHMNGIHIENVSKFIMKEVYNKNFTILVREQAPFVFYEMGNDGEMILTGFIIDMLVDFSKSLNFSYTIQFSPDRRTGIEETNSSWSGLIGALQRREVDIVASDVSISTARLQVVDFSEAFLRSSSAIVVRRVLFANFGSIYTRAFEMVVWWLIVVAVLLTALCIMLTWAVEKSSKLRGTLAVCDHAYQFSWWEAVYLLTVNLLEQGNDFYAERFSTRIVLLTFLAFSMVVLAYNNSVLTAHLAVVNAKLPFETIEDLVFKAPQYQIGIIHGGSHYYMFQDSHVPSFRMVWNEISSNPENFFNSTTEAIHRVESGHVALVDSSLTIKYEIRDSCDFAMVKLKGVTRGYHLAFPKGSRYVPAFSQQINDWKVSGLLQRLEKKYFSSRSLCTAKEDIVSLGLNHIKGIFIVLLVGFIISSFVLCAERMLSHFQKLNKLKAKSRSIKVKPAQDARKLNISVKHELQYYNY